MTFNLEAGLLRTCRQIAEEARLFAYNQIGLFPLTASDGLESMGSENLKLVRKINIHFSCPCSKDMRAEPIARSSIGDPWRDISAFELKEMWDAIMGCVSSLEDFQERNMSRSTAFVDTAKSRTTH